MSEVERRRALVKVRSQLARSMGELHTVKKHSTPSEWKQIAGIIVELGKLRDQLEKVGE